MRLSKEDILAKLKQSSDFQEFLVNTHRQIFFVDHTLYGFDQSFLVLKEKDNIKIYDYLNEDTKQLGSGEEGCVYCCKELESAEEVAIKLASEIPIDMDTQKLFQSYEFVKNQFFNHPNFLKIYGYDVVRRYENSRHLEIAVIMEICPYKLSNGVNKTLNLTTHQNKRIVKDLIDGVIDVFMKGMWGIAMEKIFFLILIKLTNSVTMMDSKNVRGCINGLYSIGIRKRSIFCII